MRGGDRVLCTQHDVNCVWSGEDVPVDLFAVTGPWGILGRRSNGDLTVSRQVWGCGMANGKTFRVARHHPPVSLRDIHRCHSLVYTIGTYSTYAEQCAVYTALLYLHAFNDQIRNGKKYCTTYLPEQSHGLPPLRDCDSYLANRINEPTFLPRLLPHTASQTAIVDWAYM